MTHKLEKVDGIALLSSEKFMLGRVMVQMVVNIQSRHISPQYTMDIYVQIHYFRLFCLLLAQGPKI